MIKNLRALPGSQNEIIVKTDIHETKTDNLYINGKLKEDFYDLDVYYYKFKSPLRSGWYYHTVMLKSIRASGERVTMTQTLNYEVVDSCR